METIKKFENLKISDMKYITGGFVPAVATADCVVEVPVRMDDFSEDDGMMYGREVRPTGMRNNGKYPDKRITTNGGCNIKIVTFRTEDTKRTVSTHNTCVRTEDGLPTLD